ncbi:MAG TPA: Ku protein [Acidobacteriota bacterium]|nr:Ku protein [Acidobacteriota bacterium]
MATRSMGKATVSFGLVSIPVKIFTASDSSKSVSFNLLDPESKIRLRQQLINPQSGEVVERKDAIKGYEFAKDQYVTFTQDELRELEAQANKTIDINEFIPAKEIDPVYFDKAYYLAPDQGGERAYALLAKALQDSGRVALARYAARGKEYLVMVRCMEDGALVMQQLRYQEEVRALDEIPIPEVEVKDSELQLAMQLIDQVSQDEFHPETYQDTVSQRVRDLIEKKVQGEDIVSVTEEAPQAQIIDLMSALKASLGDDEKRKGAKAAEDEGDEEEKEKAAES